MNPATWPIPALITIATTALTIAAIAAVYIFLGDE